MWTGRSYRPVHIVATVPRMRLTARTLAALSVLVLAGCSADEPAAQAPLVTPSSAAASSTAPAAQDAAGAQACKLVVTATDGDSTLTKPGTVDAITEAAAGAADASVREAGQMLSDRYDLAKAAQGSGDELSATTDLGTAAIKLRTACVNAGLITG